jgi:8-oxo-dGTP pyrophosphatase MutT (NUDIX family)
MLFGPDGRVWVGDRIDTPGDHWQMPQGGIDEGESPREAALRELREEIGTDKAEIIAEHPGWLKYDLPPEVSAKIWGGRYRGQMQRWFVLRFTGSGRIPPSGDGRELSNERRVTSPFETGLTALLRMRLQLLYSHPEEPR